MNIKSLTSFLTLPIFLITLFIPTPVHAATQAYISGETITPLYPVKNDANVRAIGYQQQNDQITAIDQNGQTLWTTNPGPGAMFGGFDFDNDGYPDVAIVKSELTGGTCGTTPTKKTWIIFLRGKTGGIVSGISPTEDKCWNFGTSIYPTNQFNINSILFGENSSIITVLPYYATTGWFFNFNGSSFESNSFIYPSTSSFNETYSTAAGSYRDNSHVGNGLILDVNGSKRLLFFTSNRVAQYSLTALSSTQLLTDNYFNPGARTDIAGRNYGLVAIDPNYPQNVVLISGTPAYCAYIDLNSNSITCDEWGQIERHLTIYNASTNTLNDRFFSYAHDNNDGNKYQNRIAHPNNPFIKVSSGSPSRLAYNVFTDGRWYLHISEPGTTTDKYALQNIYLWDITDLDRDGIDELIISPTANHPELTYPNYLPDWSTNIYHWDEAKLLLVPVKNYPDTVPYLTTTFRLPTKTSSAGYLAPVLTNTKNQIILHYKDGSNKAYVEETNLLGDFNSDSHVNAADYTMFIAGFGTTYTILDYANLLANYGL